MSNPVRYSFPSSHKSQFARWIQRVLGQQRICVKFRLQGNHLYILCEAAVCPDESRTLMRLLPALKQTDISTLLPDAQVYQIYLYGRQTDQKRPQWQVPIYLTQLDRHLDRLYQQQPQNFQPETELSGYASNPNASSAIVLSNHQLAKQGNVEAIAAYLSETLSKVGVRVRVKLRSLPYENPTAAVISLHQTTPAIAKRLWITCEASYSPDPSLVSEPVTQQLRELELDGFRDAIVLIQVQGEPKPDWLLRVDLTPSHEILNERARWGDVDAIARVLNKSLAEVQVGVSTAVLKQATLHLTCSWLPSVARRADTQVAPSLESVRPIITQCLDRLGPQGIHHAVLYGHVPNQTEPGWLEWVNLPGLTHMALCETAMTLSRRGDLEAIAALLSRLLNPDLDQQLATGGIRLKILPKEDLLHIMCDGAVCPDQQTVGRAIAKFLKPLRLRSIRGVRVYGRRAGQKRPQWSYGRDFVRRPRFVPEASPDFAATDALIGDLMMPSDQAVLRPDLTPDDLKTGWRNGWEAIVQTIRAGLVKSQLFTATAETHAIVLMRSSEPSADTPASPTHKPRNVALIWGTVGLLLMLQLDWLLGQWLYAAPEPSAADLDYLQDNSSLLSTSPIAPLLSPEPEHNKTGAVPNVTELPLPQDWDTAEVDTENFEAEAFTQPGDTVTIGDEAPNDDQSDPAALVPPDDVELADPDLESPLPSFNSPQLDQKLALYYDHLEQYGAPDVLIVGSSRALRGVDPNTLRQELAELGYEDVTVFNFGINGATAQVVDLLVRRLLTADQLPQLIIWADGARALNSGRTDRTYTGIASSEAYRQLQAGTLPIPQIETNSITTERPTPSMGETAGLSLQESYQAIDSWLSDRLADRSTVYEERDRIKYLFQRQLASWLPRTEPLPPAAIATLPGDPTQLDEQAVTLDPEAIAAQSWMDIRGFLPVAVEFNPATYYQQYARVSGSYDRDYESFRLEGQQAIATQTVIETAQQYDIPVVFVNMPLTDEYLDPVRSQYEQEFRQYLLSLSVNSDSFIFRDLGEIWLEEYRYFSDPSHLNRDGAESVSLRLAQDPMIPWNVAGQPQE
jgi:hypothetical protein